MSVQFGKCNFDGKPVDPEDLDRVRAVLTPYGPDGEGHVCKDNFGVLYRAFHTTKESLREIQPHICSAGVVITWDGRLDNREELVSLLAGETSVTSTDLEIVAAAHERWGRDSFARLIGDWALSIWDPRTRSLLLATDFVGVRHLYYSVKKDQVTWCTILHPLVLLSDHCFELNKEYVAGWLSSFPAPSLTPYVGIQAVPPSSFVCLMRGKHCISKYWDFDSSKQVRYRRDFEYEEHFRTVFASSVLRRLRSDTPILAELSGGMDSSAIVCMADVIMRTKRTEAPRLDTVSYYDDSEPNWNEKPYFGTIEQQRGRIGCHIDASLTDSSESVCANHFAPTPGHWGISPKLVRQLTDLMKTQGNRVILSGVGGDEITGGVPTPIPELADLLARAHLGALVRQLVAWALVKKRPLFHILFDVVREFLPSPLCRLPAHLRPAPWLHKAFVKQQRSAFSGYRRQLRVSRSLPSFQENVATTDLLRRQLACEPLSSEHPFELRYPFLDRDLLEFVFGVPRLQVIRPGQRRSLMRRSLAEIVPDAIINRKRKAFVTRSPMMRIMRERSHLSQFDQRMELGALGIIDEHLFRSALDGNAQGKETNVVAVMRAFALERWLRNAKTHRVLEGQSEGFGTDETYCRNSGETISQKIQLAS